MYIQGKTTGAVLGGIAGNAEDCMKVSETFSSVLDQLGSIVDYASQLADRSENIALHMVGCNSLNQCCKEESSPGDVLSRLEVIVSRLRTELSRVESSLGRIDTRF